MYIYIYTYIHIHTYIYMTVGLPEAVVVREGPLEVSLDLVAGLLGYGLIVLMNLTNIITSIISKYYYC